MRKAFASGLIALAAGTAAVGAYILVFLPWQHRWGATDEEVHRTLPGDDQIPHPDTQWTRAITVQAKAADIWPWLVQIGQGRGGHYSYPWLEKLMGLRVEHADQINPVWQHLKEGDIIPAEPGGGGYWVITVEAGRALVLGAREEDEGVGLRSVQKERLIEDNLLGPWFLLAVCPDFINKREREKHLEPMRPSRPFFSKSKNCTFFFDPTRQFHDDE
jgi:hypothetical protein